MYILLDYKLWDCSSEVRIFSYLGSDQNKRDFLLNIIDFGNI